MCDYLKRLQEWRSVPLEDQHATMEAVHAQSVKPSCERPKGLDKELVVVKYREPTAWTLASPHFTTIYDKFTVEPAQSGPRVRVIPSPNLGREAGSYLTHICNHYDDLADMTFLAQGSPHCSIDEFFGRITTTYSTTTSLTSRYKLDYPGPLVKALDKVERHGDYEVRYGRADRHGNRSADRNRDWLDRVWSTWMVGPQPEEWYFGYAACWAVKRESITARPLEWWKYARDSINAAKFDPHRWDIDPKSAWAAELLWGIWFDSPDRYQVKMPPPDRYQVKMPPPDRYQVKMRPKKKCGCGADRPKIKRNPI